MDRLAECNTRMRMLHYNWQHDEHVDESIFDHVAMRPYRNDLTRQWKVLDGTKREWAYKADLLRMCIVYALGGVYLDTDLYFMRRLDAPDDDLTCDELILAKVKDDPLLVGEAVLGAPARSDKVRRMLENYLAKRPTPDGVIAPSFSRLARDHGWMRWCHAPEVFVPHDRHDPDDRRYDYTLRTRAIHLWGEKDYDFKRLAKIAAALGE